MALDGISRNDYEKLMRYTLPNDYFENVSRNRGRGQNNAWGPDYCFPDGLNSTKYTNSLDRKFNVFALDVEYSSIYQDPEHVALVAWDGNTIYEEHIQDLHFTTKMLMRHLNANTIIIGHAVHKDLKALKIAHHRIIDTTEVFRETPNSKAPKLKLLAKEYLNKDIQTGNRKHDPVVDALTCIELMRTEIKSEPCRQSLESNLPGYSDGLRPASVTSLDVGLAIGLGIAAVGAAIFGSLWSDQTEKEEERERQQRRNF